MRLESIANSEQVDLLVQRNNDGVFAEGNNIGDKAINDIVSKTARLRNQVIDQLLANYNGSGKSHVQYAIDKCAKDKPEQLLQLFSRMLPKAIEFEMPAFSPVIVNQVNVSGESESEAKKNTLPCINDSRVIEGQVIERED